MSEAKILIHTLAVDAELGHIFNYSKHFATFIIIYYKEVNFY